MRTRNGGRPSHDALRENLAAEARKMGARGYVTAHAAAKRSGRGLATVYRWLRHGTLKGTQTGPEGTLRRCWVSEESLAAILGGKPQETAKTPVRRRRRADSITT